jgi:hypothetical protein
MYKVFRPVSIITMLILIASLVLTACGASPALSGSAGLNQSDSQSGAQSGAQPGVQPGAQPGAQPGVNPESTTPASTTVIAIVVAVLILAVLGFAITRRRKSTG